MSCSKGCCETNREHWLSIGVSASATPTRRPSVVKTEETERVVTQERDAYKRLKNDGLQPARLMGASHIERHARDELEVRTGHQYKDLKLAHDAAALGKELHANAVR